MVFSQISSLQEELNKSQNKYQINYFRKISKRPFLVCSKQRLVIDFLFHHNSILIANRIRKFNNKQFTYIPIIMNQECSNTVNKIKEFIKPNTIEESNEDDIPINNSKFLMDCSTSLNKTIPKSEIWFRSKIEADPLFKKFGFVYNEVLMGYIYDLFSKKYRVAIEVDGTWHDRLDQKSRDIKKEALIVQKGWTIIRVKANDEFSYESCIRELNEILTNRNRHNERLKKKLEAKMFKRYY